VPIVHVEPAELRYPSARSIRTPPIPRTISCMSR
jgi:hypothetical protein